MLQRVSAASTTALNGSRQCLHMTASVRRPCQMRQQPHRSLHTQLRSARPWWSASRSTCLHLGLATLTVASGSGLAVRCMAASGQTITEKATGINYPEVTRFWHPVGEAYRCLGAAVRTKKVAFINVKVYAVALFVEAEAAAKELGVRSRGGFFEGNNDDDYAQALTDGAFSKLLQVELVRKVEGAQFFEAIEEALTPRLSITGELSTLSKFKDYFNGKVLDKGTNILLLWKTEGKLEVVSKQNPGAFDYSQVQPDLTIESPGLCRALFEVYTGSNAVVPDAKASWADGARRLIDSDETRRNTRKAGSG